VPNATQLASGPTERFECKNGWASVGKVGRVIVITMSGNVDAASAKRIAGALNAQLEAAGGPVRTFWDLEALERYHSDVRVLCTQALLRNWANVAGLQTLAKNRIVKMGVAVANVALRGKIKNTESRAEFDSLLRAACDADP
jgi:hypothetical protein